MAYRKVPSYIYKARQGYVLQRAVPTDVREVLAKAKFKESGGQSLAEARTRVPGFLSRTDEWIRTARLQSRLTTNELIEALPELTAGWGDPEDVIVALQMHALEGVNDLTKAQEQRGIELLCGTANPRSLYTPEDLLAARRNDRQPAARTYQGWKQALTSFMNFTQKASPISCTEKDAVAYKDKLLGSLGRSTVKVQIAYLSGLWTTLIEKNRADKLVHIFKGLTSTVDESTKQKALKAAGLKQNQVFVSKHIDDWCGSVYLPVFKLLYYTGCRLSEIAALRGEDIREDFISVEWLEERSLKTANSVRDIPIHPLLAPVVGQYRGIKGHIWPQLRTSKVIDGIQVNRWGHNLSKPCRKVTGLKPKDFRDRFATQLRSLDFNQVNIERLMGHSSITVNSSYGGRDWSKYVQMVQSIF